MEMEYKKEKIEAVKMYYRLSIRLISNEFKLLLSDLRQS